LFRSLEALSQQKKTSKAGRPPLPKGSAKAETLRIRITPDELRSIEATAKTKKQTVSEWIRSTLNAAIQS
jgi:predicted HicB family RNase H-like nuclease